MEQKIYSLYDRLLETDISDNEILYVLLFLKDKLDNLEETEEFSELYDEVVASIEDYGHLTPIPSETAQSFIKEFNTYFKSLSSNQSQYVPSVDDSYEEEPDAPSADDSYEEEFDDPSADYDSSAIIRLYLDLVYQILVDTSVTPQGVKYFLETIDSIVSHWLPQNELSKEFLNFVRKINSNYSEYKPVKNKTAEKYVDRAYTYLDIYDNVIHDGDYDYSKEDLDVEGYIRELTKLYEEIISNVDLPIGIILFLMTLIYKKLEKIEKTPEVVELIKDIKNYIKLAFKKFQKIPKEPETPEEKELFKSYEDRIKRIVSEYIGEEDFEQERLEELVEKAENLFLNYLSQAYDLHETYYNRLVEISDVSDELSSEEFVERTAYIYDWLDNQRREIISVYKKIKGI